MYFGRLLCYFLIAAVVVFEGLNVVASSGLFLFTSDSPNFAASLLALLSKPTAELLAQAADEIIPLVTVAVFGGLGAALRVLVAYMEGRSLEEREKGGSPDGRRRVTEVTISLGVLLAIVGYLLVKSKIFIKLFYEGTVPASLEINFNNIALIGVLFGFFSVEVLGMSHRLVTRRLNALERADAATFLSEERGRSQDSPAAPAQTSAQEKELRRTKGNRKSRSIGKPR